MKKAKLMLAGIACMAVVGGAFAINAVRAQHTFYGTSILGGACNVTKSINYTTTLLPTTTLSFYSVAPTTLTSCTVAVIAAP